MKLKRRLTLFFVAVIAAGSLSSFVFVRLSTETLFRSFVFSGDAAKAEHYAVALRDFYAERGSWMGVEEYLDHLSASLYAPPPSVPSARTEGGHPMAMTGGSGDVLSDRVVLTDRSGVVVADSSGELLGTVHPPRHLAHGIPVSVGGSTQGTVLVGSMVDSSLRGTGETFLVSVTLSLLVSTLLSAALAFALGLAFAARVTGPVVALNAAVKRVAAGDLSAVVPETGRDEISELSISFNKMARELEKLEEAKRRIIADAAHELRTPTTLIRGTIEGMIDGVFSADQAGLRSVHEETLRLSRLIDTLRELELIESGRMKLEIAEVDLAETAARAVSLFAAAAQEKSVKLSVEVGEPRPAAVRVDPFRLDEVVYNLLANALKHAGKDGRVRVSVRAEGDAWVLLSVDDTGPGVPAAERERIFERFYRTDASRNADSGGRGLGLAIVSEIVKAHDGSVSVAESDLGGASFVVRLPGR